MQVELHRHLEASIRLETAYELAGRLGIVSKSTSLESFRDHVVVHSPVSSLSEFLSRFDFFQKILDRPEVIERVAFEAVEDCWREGSQAVELRYSPSFLSEKSGVSWKDALDAICRGLERAKTQYPESRSGLICTASRDYGPDRVDETIEFFLAHSHQFIGLDLAGNEDQFPCRLFESSFKKAIQAGAQITIHAGEASGAENIWEAIELLGAQRIGHGVRCIEDPELMKTLAARSICLENCPTSNWLTHTTGDLTNHPLPMILRSGIPVTINTDDPLICGTTLDREIQICKEVLGMSQEEIGQCLMHAKSKSFLQLK